MNLDHKVAHAMGLKSVNNCEKWGTNMKEHFCPAEQSIISYQDQCNWCGEQESKIGCVNHDCDKCKAQRTWVGLTDEDKHEIELRAGITEDDDGYIVSQVFKLTEAKLKEKNA